MNVVVKVTTIIASLMLTGLVILPRILVYFGLNLSILQTIISPWATFLIVLIAALIIMGPWMRNPKILPFGLVACLAVAILVAVAVTMYQCGL